MVYQATLAMTVQTSGVGLHSGNEITITLKPAAPRTGIVFVRTDLGGASVKASLENVDFSALQMATTLRKDHVVIQTTEHLLSALYARGIDNVVVELSAPEVPIMDGSAEPFLRLIDQAGVRSQSVRRQVLKITRPFSFSRGDRTLCAAPADDYRISYDIDFDHPSIRSQCKTVVVNSDAYAHEVASARTFGFLRDVEYLKTKGLIKGASLENALVLDDSGVVNELRSKDEFVSHKILDMIGDLAVGGFRMQGHFTASKAGHEVHAHFLKALLENVDCYEMVDARDAALPPVGNPAPAFAGAA